MRQVHRFLSAVAQSCCQRRRFTDCFTYRISASPEKSVSHDLAVNFRHRFTLGFLFCAELAVRFQPIAAGWPATHLPFLREAIAFGIGGNGLANHAAELFQFFFG